MTNAAEFDANDDYNWAYDPAPFDEAWVEAMYYIEDEIVFHGSVRTSAEACDEIPDVPETLEEPTPRRVP